MSDEVRKSTEKYFEDTLIINIKPRKEGSLIDVLTLVVNSPTILALVTIFVTKFFDVTFSSAIPKTDETSKKLENILKIKEEIKKGNLTETDFDYIASNDKDLKKQKSNFFKNIIREPQVKEIEATANVNNSRQIGGIIVYRKDFDSFYYS